MRMKEGAVLLMVDDTDNANPKIPHTSLSNFDGDGLTINTSTGLIDVQASGTGGLTVSAFGIAAVAKENGGIIVDADGLSLAEFEAIATTELGDVSATVASDGQILQWVGTSEAGEYQPVDLSGNHSFTAGAGLQFNEDATELSLTNPGVGEFIEIQSADGATTPSVPTGETNFAIGPSTVITTGDKQHSIVG